jgi:cytochrome b561
MTPLSHRIYQVLWMTIGAIFCALAVELLLTSQPERPFGHTQESHVLGWMGLAMIGLSVVYPIKRRLHPNQIWAKRWFQVHQVFGIVGPLVIFVHSGSHFHAQAPLFALVVMMLVVLSGIAGQSLHYLAFRKLYEQRHELAAQGVNEERIEAQLHDLALNEGRLRWWRCVHGPLTWSFVIFTFLHIVGALYFGGM